MVLELPRMRQAKIARRTASSLRAPMIHATGRATTAVTTKTDRARATGTHRSCSASALPAADTAARAAEWTVSRTEPKTRHGMKRL